MIDVKYIYPFIPSGLQIDRNGTILPVKGINGSFYVFEEMDESEPVETIGLIDSPLNKLLLYPLSKLLSTTNELEETLIEKIVNQTNTYCDAYQEWLESYLDNPIPDRIVQAPYEVVETLFALQIDVFNFIGLGFAKERPNFLVTNFEIS